MTPIHSTSRTTPSRLAKRASYDPQTIYAILDEAIFCTVAFNLEGSPFQIPTGFARMENKLYLHGSVGSHYMRALAEGKVEASVGITLMDGLVLARSAFSHSVNYRSVVIFGKPQSVEDQNEKWKSLEVFTNKIVPGRWNDTRKPSESEMNKTMVLSISIEEASAKIRTGGPNDDAEDYTLNHWAGVIPLRIERLAPIADEKLRGDIVIPVYLKR